MSTYYVLIEYPIQKASMFYLTSTKDESKTAQLKYKITFTNHFKYLLTADDHNSLRQSRPYLEVT